MIDLAKKYTLKERDDFSEDVRTEYENGYIVLMASPTVKHQEIVGWLYFKIRGYLIGKRCKVFMAPLDVDLFKDGSYIYQPDLFILCDETKNRNLKIVGAPEWVCEVASSKPSRDYVTKLNIYKQAGVKEYWVVDQIRKNIMVCDFVHNSVTDYSFMDNIEITVLENCKINFKEMEN